MRVRSAVWAGLLVLGCSTSGASGPRVSVLGGADEAESRPEPGERPDQPPQQSYSKELYSSQPAVHADALLLPREALARHGDAFRLVRPVTDETVAPVSGGDPFPAAVIPVRVPRPGELAAGEKVYFCEAPAGRFEAARSAGWQLGTVERVDPVFGHVVVDGRTLDPTTDVLLPAR